MADRIYNANEYKIELIDGATTIDLGEAESIDFAIDDNAVDWTSFNNFGWASIQVTGRKASFSVMMKATTTNQKYFREKAIGDVANVNNLKIKITFPILDDTHTVPETCTFNGSISFNGNQMIGSSLDVSSFSFDFLCNGIPTITPES